MLTPIELQNKSFKSGGLGYDKKDVDQFFREVNDNYLRLYSENIDLRDKVAALNDALQQYKSMEKTLQRALVLAEKTAEDTKEAAIKNARTIEKEAQTKSQIILADARNELERIHAQTLDMLKQFEKYKAQFKSLAAAQIELLESESYSINAAKLDAFIGTTKAALPENALPEKGKLPESALPEKGRLPERRSPERASASAAAVEPQLQAKETAARREPEPRVDSRTPYTEEIAVYEEPEDDQADFDFINL
ncbi:MAG: DivIVA domain-containing protein [Lachnospiraceae bacterium]|nr:DivIVA domain-containing protein [Lachnospiraceae bacterium]